MFEKKMKIVQNDLMSANLSDFKFYLSKTKQMKQQTNKQQKQQYPYSYTQAEKNVFSSALMIEPFLYDSKEKIRKKSLIVILAC